MEEAPLGLTNTLTGLVIVYTAFNAPFATFLMQSFFDAIPKELEEAAMIDGANGWQKFRYITLPMIAPFLLLAAMIRTVDALKSFDIIYAITQGGPGTASETINLYLYSVAFAYYDVGYGSAIAVVFFVLIVALSLVLLHLRQRSKWNEIGDDR